MAVRTVGYHTLKLVETLLQSQRLEPRKCGSDAQVEHDARVHRVGLCHVEVHGMLSGTMDLPSLELSERAHSRHERSTHCAIIALNRARLTVIVLRTSLHTLAISEPMCSPSRSQSVHIISICAPRISFLRFRLMSSFVSFTFVIVGASKSTKGSHAFQPYCAESKSCSSRWPATAVTVNWALIWG